MAFETNKARVTWEALDEIFTGRSWVIAHIQTGAEDTVKQWAVDHAHNLTDRRIRVQRIETWTLPE